MKAIFSLLSLLFVSAIFCIAATGGPRPVQITVDLDADGIAVAPTMHGIFFEDINYAADGGLYAELVQNRSFEHNNPLYAWSETARGRSRGSIEILSDRPLHPNNPTYARLNISRRGDGFGLANDGFTGVPVKAGETYFLSLHFRSPNRGLPMSAIIETGDGRELARVNLPSPERDWRKIEVTFRPTDTDPAARLVILAHRDGQVDLDMVSLFPENTFKGRRNGVRADLAQALAYLQPGFLRFPGGCLAEGRTLDDAYNWKNSVGPIERRPQNINLWQNPAFPEYHQTLGLGFFELFQLAEDLGAIPVPVVNVGMVCQVRNIGQHAPVDELGPWIDKALALIEFANGPADSPWGSVRAAMGREEPFNMVYLGTGNEHWGQEYFDRYAVFQRIFSERHPEIKLIGNAGVDVVSWAWRFAWDKFNSGEAIADMVNEHCYVSPSWMLSNSNRYELYDRNAPPVMLSEFAAHEPDRRGTLRAALAEASFMTGLLRNADVVRMASYAPLFSRRGHAQWEPNLIWFDNSGVLLTPSYHVQAIYGRNRPDRVLPTEVIGETPPPPTVGGRIALGSWNTQAEFRNIIVTGPDGAVLFRSDFSAPGLGGWEPARGNWRVENDALRQTEHAPDRRAYAGDPRWGDYTLTLQARKISGNEGFMIYFGAGRQGMGHWNLGGWGNTMHGLSVPGLPLAQRRGRIEAGRWYDIRIELRGAEIAAYLDGERLQSASLAALSHKPLYAVVGRDDRAGELVVYLANPAQQAVAASIDLRGRGSIGNTARLVRLEGDPDAVNTFEDPHRIRPSETKIEIPGRNFEITLPPFSFTLLRISHEK